MAARLDSPPRVEEEEADMDAEEEEEIRLATRRISAALERHVTEQRSGGPTAESTVRYLAALRGPAPSLGRLLWPPPFRMRASPTTRRVQDEELSPRMEESVVDERRGSVLRMQEGEPAAATILYAKKVGDDDGGREDLDYSSTDGVVGSETCTAIANRNA